MIEPYRYSSNEEYQHGYYERMKINQNMKEPYVKFGGIKSDYQPCKLISEKDAIKLLLE